MSAIDMNSVAGFKAVDAEGNELGIMSLADITAAVKESLMQDAAMARSVATLSEASTRAVTDTYEDKLTEKNDLKWARALDADGNPILISKESLASVVGELLSSLNLYPFMYRGVINGDVLDGGIKTGYYAVNEVYGKALNLPEGLSYGSFLKIGGLYGGYSLVFAANHIRKGFYANCRTESGWIGWSEL